MKPPVDPGIYLLADHLDAALAAGEDLLAADLAAPADIDRAEPGASAHAVAVFVNNLKRLEAALAARILQARRRAAELPRQDPLVRGVVDLFQSSTSSALTLVEHFSRLHEGTTFDPSYLTPHAVLRSRGLLAPDAAELPPFERVIVTEAYLIGGVLRLGEILNVVATTLDTLDNHFDLYLDAAAQAAGASLESVNATFHDPAELLQAVVEASAALSEASAAASPVTAPVGSAEVNSKIAPESHSTSATPSASSDTPASPIEASPVINSAEPVSAPSKSAQASASIKPAAPTQSKPTEADTPDTPSVAKAADPSSTAASTADASAKATAEPANATAATTRAAANAQEPEAATSTAPDLDMPVSGSAPAPKLAAAPSAKPRESQAPNAAALDEKARAVAEPKISVTALAEKSAAAVRTAGEQKKVESSRDAVAAELPAPKDDKTPGQSTSADAKPTSTGKADKPAEKFARATETAQPKAAKKPMTLIEALAALDKSRPPSAPTG